MPRLTSTTQKRNYQRARDDGYSMRDAIIRPGVAVSLSTARKWEAERKKRLAKIDGEIQVGRLDENLPLPKPYAKLNDNAKRAFDDFAFFQQHYLGRISQPWQADAAEQLLALLESPKEEYCVVNVAPGMGKTVLFTHDIPAWLTIRNRAVRGLIGSATQALANRNVLRLRRTLESPVKIMPSSELLRQGIAVVPEGILTVDFGRFKPLDRELWTREQFIVMQYDGSSIVEKEPTWSAYGMDTGFIGGRFDFVIWDDLVDPRKLRGPERKEDLERMWSDVAETRLEPGGLLVLQGQRLSSDDLYRYALDMKAGGEGEYAQDDPEAPGVTTGSRQGMKYHHIVYKAHYTDKCTPENHVRGAPSWPQGCLLSSWRLPYTKIKTLQENQVERFEVIYQQEDTADSESLVPKNWIYGDSAHYGCLDRKRDILEVPQGLVGLQSYVAVDPSPTQFWGLIWFLYHPESEQRFLFNMVNKKMDATDLLDFNYNDGTFYGIMEEWQSLSHKLGVPISHWIVEINAAQRFLLQYDHTRRWVAKNGCEILPHSTAKNKSDQDLGVWTIRHHYEFGRYRLPYREHTEGRALTMRLVNELVRYPEGRTDDLVMCNWFFEWQLPRIFNPRKAIVKQDRPSWLLESA